MKEPTKPEQLTLTYKDGQWTDQHGRKVVNDEEVSMGFPVKLYMSTQMPQNQSHVWPGTYEVVAAANESSTSYSPYVDAIQLIAPTGSENSAPNNIDEELKSEMNRFAAKLAASQQDIASDIRKIVNEHFMDMVSGSVPEKSDNEIIAEFMGVKIGVDEYSWRPGCFEPLKSEHLAYHNNWSWLMPVVEKIVSLDYRFNMDMFKGKRCAISNIDPMMHIVKAGDNCVYEAVVEFIKWHNKLATA